jgi:hypothetical protein
MENNIEIVQLPVDAIDTNNGQIEGLDTNPRSWTFNDVENLAKSIEQTPALLEKRGLIVFPHNGRYVAIGGNMRLVALRMLKRETAPCIVLPEDTTIEKLKEIAIKDNGSFGTWDEQLLLEDWDGTPFDEWGINVFFDEGENEEKSDKRPKNDDRDGFEVKFEAKEFDFVNRRLHEINEADPGQALLSLIRDDQEEGEDE